MRWLSGSARAAYLTLAVVALICGVIGILLPLVPTTPFLLLAAWAASKGSPRLQKWILTHPKLGPPLSAWRNQGAVPTSAKRLAGAALAISWAMLWFKGFDVPVLVVSGMGLVGIGIFIFTRPAPVLAEQFTHPRIDDRFCTDNLCAGFDDIRCYDGCPAYADIRAYHDPEAYHE